MSYSKENPADNKKPETHGFTDKRRVVTLSDIIFTAAISLIAIAVFAFAGSEPQANAVQVVIRRDGKIIAALPLDKNTLYEVEGDYRNVLEIADGEVFMRYTDCPDKSCQRAGRISSGGRSIICAPNKVSAVIEGIDGDVDAYTG